VSPEGPAQAPASSISPATHHRQLRDQPELDRPAASPRSHRHHLPLPRWPLASRSSGPNISPRSGPSSEVLSIPGGLCLLPGAFRAAKACPRAPQAFLHANSCFPQYDQYQLIYIPVLQNLRTSACQHVLGRGDADRAIGTAWKKPSCHWGWGHGHAGGCTPASSH